MVKILGNSLASAFTIWLLIVVTVSLPFEAKANENVPMIAKFADKYVGFQFSAMTGSPPPPPAGMTGSPPPPPAGMTGSPPPPPPGGRPGGPPPPTTTASSG